MDKSLIMYREGQLPKGYVKCQQVGQKGDLSIFDFVLA